MDNILEIMSPEERAAFSLCALYESAGYQKYRMSKFEEYALYVQNKDFLVSEDVHTRIRQFRFRKYRLVKSADEPLKVFYNFGYGLEKERDIAQYDTGKDCYLFDL